MWKWACRRFFFDEYEEIYGYSFHQTRIRSTQRGIRYRYRSGLVVNRRSKQLAVWDSMSGTLMALLTSMWMRKCFVFDVSIACALRHSPYSQGGSTCDSTSDSGISDGDSEGVGGRARRLSALRELARRLQAALAPNSPAHRAVAKVNYYSI